MKASKLPMSTTRPWFTPHTRPEGAMPLLSWGRRNPRRGGAVPRGGFALQSWKDDQWSKSWPDIHRVEQFSRRRCATADLALGRQNNAFGLLLSAFPRLSTMRVSLALLAAALLLGTALCSATDPPQCSGHGTLVDGKCRCDNPWPQEGGQGGWTGPECSIPVYRGKPDGADMAAACGDCASLQPGDWACFAVRAPWNDSSFNYLTMLLILFLGLFRGLGFARLQHGAQHGKPLLSRQKPLLCAAMHLQHIFALSRCAGYPSLRLWLASNPLHLLVLLYQFADQMKKTVV